MGVLGLTPFLQKTCPEVLKLLPDRLKGLTGKTIVITHLSDGTLITQRLHFAQTPHPYRHVMGWYRIVNELKEEGVRTICVFDGKQRNTAKAREAERRKQVQKLSIARGSLELDRLTRLRKLLEVLNDYKSLQGPERTRVADVLKQLGPKSAFPKEDTLDSPVTKLDAVLADLPASVPFSQRSSSQIPDEPHEYLPVAPDSQAENDLAASMDDETIPLVDAELPSPTDLTEAAEETSKGAIESEVAHPSRDLTENDDITEAASCIPSTEVPPVNPSSVAADPLEPVVEDIPTKLASLYLDYQNSIPKVVSLSAPLSTSDSPLTEVEVTEVQTENVMSKYQVQLTIDEGKFWDELVQAATTPESLDTKSEDPDAISTGVNLDSLTDKSFAMSESFQRRTNPPTSQTYQECKEILTAMGVPVIEPVGAFEAEALAAALVIHGLADYVASEDTDVLVYEAPLIRNLTNRKGPLLVVSDVRTVLELDRASFVDFALLLGTDFSQRIKNVGPARALKFIREHGSIERVIEQETKFPPRLPADVYLEQVEVARLVFATLPPIPDKELLEQKDSDPEAVAAVLQRYGLHRISSTDWDYTSALEGNFFKDDPTAW